MISGLSACEPEEIPGGGGGENIDLTTGRAEFDFTFQDFRVPASGLHRIDLSLSKDAISLYRGEFLAAANVSVFGFVGSAQAAIAKMLNDNLKGLGACKDHGDCH